jgi:hypothetical protein
MRKLLLVFWLLLTVSLLTSCSSMNFRGRVRSQFNEPILTPAGLQFIYSGQRGVVNGVTWPNYSITPVRFGDVIVSVLTPPGWSVNQLDQTVHMQNRAVGALIIINAARYPTLELHRQRIEVSNFDFQPSVLIQGTDARRTSYFTFSRSDGEAGAMIGLYTDYRNSSSGVVLFGRWSAEYASELMAQMGRIARNIVIRSVVH